MRLGRFRCCLSPSFPSSEHTQEPVETLNLDTVFVPEVFRLRRVERLEVVRQNDVGLCCEGTGEDGCVSVVDRERKDGTDSGGGGPIEQLVGEGTQERKERASRAREVPVDHFLEFVGHDAAQHQIVGALFVELEGFARQANTTTVLSANVLGEGLLTPPLPGPTGLLESRGFAAL